MYLEEIHQHGYMCICTPLSFVMGLHNYYFNADRDILFLTAPEDGCKKRVFMLKFFML